MKPEGQRVTVKVAGTECTFETGRIAKLASAAVVGRCGEDVVLATVVVGRGDRDLEFLPLVVEYREKLAATGRIPGNFQRREGRIGDHEVLMSRLIDRTVRSLFPKGYHREVQVQVQVLSANPDSDPTSLALLTATAAVHLSPAPAQGPAAGLRILRERGIWRAFGSRRQRAEADLDFVVGVGPDGVVMVEGEAAEVGEADCVAALEHAQGWLGRFRKAFAELATGAGAKKDPPPERVPLPPLPDAVRGAVAAAIATRAKAARIAAAAAAREAALAALPEQEPALVGAAVDALRAELVREAILAGGERLDGRGPTDVRPIWAEAGWLPRAHGSAIFTRGETQALVTCTLGTADDAQRWEDLAGEHREHFLLHYNFPPYSVNEPRPLRGPGRREIGHGMLARRGVSRTLPSSGDFPYTIRIESEIAESNGSSSMATACGASLALMDAGVPIRAPVAGIAMGMVSDGQRSVVLSDILGDEDHLGDMDFKVIGTADGVTALQLDNKIGGLTGAQLQAALEQARAGRLHILAAMAAVLATPRESLSQHAPHAHKTAIMPASLGILFGPRGANIRAIEQSTGARIAADDHGVVTVYAADGPSASAAMRAVLQSVGVVRADRCYRAVITSVRDFGAFARINDVNEGLIPAEELSEERGQRPADAVKEGDEVVVQVLGTDGRGRLRLSRRRALGVDQALIEF